MSLSIPEGWTNATLEEVATWSSGGTPSRSNSGFFSGDIPWFKSGELGPRLLTASDETISESALASSSAKLFPAGSVAIAMYGATIGKASILGVDATTNQACAVGIPTAVTSEFLHYFVVSQAHRFVEAGKGGAQPNISQSIVKSWPVLVPPHNEQLRIVEKLDELLSDLDAGVAELKTAQKKLALYRQSLLKAAVEGALTADWRAERAERAARGESGETGAQLLARILRERRARWEAKQLARFAEQGKTPPKGWQDRYSQPALPDTNSLPPLPSEWIWAKVTLCGDVQLGRQRAPQFHTGPNMVPYLRVANVFEDRIDISDVMEMHFSQQDEEAFRLQSGDVLLNEGQSLELVGRPAIFRDELPRACFTNTVVRFRAETDVLPEFALIVFLAYMHMGRFKSIATITTNIAHLGAGRFAELEFPLPGIAEQRQIVKTVGSALEQLKRQADAIDHGLKQAAAQRKNILKSAFSGQLVAQDPTDEPASALLARIRAEREKGGESGKRRRAREAGKAS